MEKRSFRDSVRVAYLNVAIWCATRITKLAQVIFMHAWDMAVAWDVASSKTAVPAPKVEENPVAEPEALVPAEQVEANSVADTQFSISAEKPSVRARRRRAERRAAMQAAQPQEAPVEPQTPTPEPAAAPASKGKLIAPEVNPFTDGNGPVPMCMDPLPDFVVFEAMFNKKYGKHGRCTLNINGMVHPYSALELFTLLTKIEAEGEKASPGSCAL